MKILLLHQHFNTPEKGGSLRSYYLAKALVDKGIHVIVISAHTKNNYTIQNVDGIEVHLLPVDYNNRFGFYRRSFSFIKFLTGAIRLSKNFKDADLCYAISVPLTVGLSAMAIRRLYKIPYVFEVGDLWPDAPIQMGFVKNRILQSALYSLEKRIYKNASAIVALSISIKQRIENKISFKKIHLIPNMADTDFFNPEEKNPMLTKKYSVEGKFVVSYIGALGYANGLDYLLACAHESQKANLSITFLICGDGAMARRLKESAKKLSLSNVIFIQFQNREGVREVMNVTDATFICYRSAPILETGSPNKYFDGLAAGKLTIINFGGWIKQEIEREKCGVYINPKQPTEFLNVISPFLNDRSLLQQHQSAGRALAEKKYSRKILSEKYYALITASGKSAH